MSLHCFFFLASVRTITGVLVVLKYNSTKNATYNLPTNCIGVLCMTDVKGGA